MRIFLAVALSLGSIANSYSPAYAATVYSFTNASATGNTGPTQAQVTAAYTATTLASAVTVSTQGIQQWTVPTSGEYQIAIAGAAGGSGAVGAGGNGARITHKVNLTSGTILSIVVGQKGANYLASSFPGGGGGGGSFVYKSSDFSYISAAGGGGGGASASSALTSTQSTAHGKADTTSGTTVTINSYSAAGGTNGGGGGVNSRGILYGGPGAGINGNGTTSNGGQGRSRLNGWIGGSGNGTAPSAGGFGGGGSAGAENSAPYGWAGGGGGYSGGAAGGNAGMSDGQYGGGGGSYYTGTLVSSVNGENSGHGYVTITALKASPTISIALPGGATSAAFNVQTTITSTTSQDGTVNFMAAGTSISGCVTVSTSAGSATCSWTPAATGNISLTATITPTDSANYNAATSSGLAITVGAGPSTTTLSLAGNVTSVEKRTAINLTATVTVAGKVTFFSNGKRIAGCIKKVAASTTAVCSVKASVVGKAIYTASFTPTSASYLSSTSAPLEVNVVRRTGTR